MKKTYVTTMPNSIGAFLQASKCFAELGINITRVSYNTAIDANMLFIDVDAGNEEQLRRADEALAEIGYLPQNAPEPKIILIVFRLRDVPGAVTAILALIEQYGFNISYLSSQEDGSGFQMFKMGLFVEDQSQIEDFLAQAQCICPAHVVDYNRSEKNFDNRIFYRSFISGLAEMAQLGKSEQQELLVHANLAMQTLDERGLLPYRTFDSIFCFAKLLSECRGDAFIPRITEYDLSEQAQLVLIEPDCGSNTALLRAGKQLLVIDCGYACYRDEMLQLFRRLIPDYDRLEKTVLITHADVDHCGLLPLFDRVIGSEKSVQCLKNEFHGMDGFREQNPLHKPYIRMCKLLSGYRPPEPDTLHAAWPSAEDSDALLVPVGTFDFSDLHFTVYEGRGGHLPGEIVLLEHTRHIAFTGDIYVNIKGMTPAQQQYNQYAPILMTSVDTDPALCSGERKQLLSMLGDGRWMIFGAHGSMKLHER